MGKINFALALLLLSTSLAMIPWRASAGVVEVSAGFSFNQSTYSENSFSWTRRWGASVGYQMTELTQLEFGFQDVTDRTHIPNYEDTTFKDKIYSLSWVQYLANKQRAVQPYFKIGIGQLNREATGNYAGGSSPPEIVDSLTGILGAGLKIYLTRAIGLRGELTSYLTGGSIRTYKDNIGATFGLSYYF